MSLKLHHVYYLHRTNTKDIKIHKCPHGVCFHQLPKNTCGYRYLVFKRLVPDTFFLSNCLFYPQTEFSTSNGRRLQTLTEALVTASCFEAFDDGPGKSEGRVVSEEQHAYEKIYGGFLKWWYPTTMGFPTKNDHFGVFGGYHYLRKHPYIFNIQTEGSMGIATYYILTNFIIKKLSPTSRQIYHKNWSQKGTSKKWFSNHWGKPLQVEV